MFLVRYLLKRGAPTLEKELVGRFKGENITNMSFIKISFNSTVDNLLRIPDFEHKSRG